MKELWESRVWSAAAIVGFCFGALGADALADRHHQPPEATDGSLRAFNVMFDESHCRGNPPAAGDQITLVGRFRNPTNQKLEDLVLLKDVPVLFRGMITGTTEGHPIHREYRTTSVLVSSNEVEILALASEMGKIFPAGCEP